MTDGRDVKRRMIVHTALELAKNELDGASLSEILKASGAPRGSIYHHFPEGKEELVLAALALAGEQANVALSGLRGQPATKIAEAFINLWRVILSRSGLSAGCAVVAVTVAARRPSLLAAAGAVFRGWREMLADLLSEGGVARARAPGLAVGLIAACEGAVALARAEQSIEVFELAAAEQMAAIDAAMEHRARDEAGIPDI